MQRQILTMLFHISVVILSISNFTSSAQTVAEIYILDIAWSPDGLQVATVGGHWNGDSFDNYGYLSVTDIQTQEAVFTVRPTSLFTSVDWSPDGKWLALGSFDSTVWIINAQTGEHLNTLYGHQSTVTDVQWSKDGQTLLSTGNWDELVLIWETTTYTPIRQLHFNAHTNSALFTPDNTFVVIATESGVFITPVQGVFETTIGRDSLLIETWIKQLAYSPDGQYLAVGTIAHTSQITGLRDTSQIIIVDLIDNSITHTFESDSGSIAGLAWGLNSRELAVLNQDNLLTIWSIEQGEIIATSPVMGLEKYQLGGVVYSDYGGRLIFGQAFEELSEQSLTSKSFQIIVPAPSLDKLNAIAALCVRDSVQRTEAVSALTNTPITTLEALPDFVAQIEALPDGAIPAACKADVLAVAQALTVQP